MTPNGVIFVSSFLIPFSSTGVHSRLDCSVTQYRQTDMRMHALPAAQLAVELSKGSIPPPSVNKGHHASASCRI